LIVAVVAVALATGGIKVLADGIASFAVAEPDKTVNVTRGNSVDSTSTVTVSDPDAIDGYLIKAKLSADIASDFTVQIWSDASTFCSETSKCTLTTTDQQVYRNLTDSATQEPADEITFNVRIVANMSAPISQHDIYIDYTKEPILVPATMQGFSADICDTIMPYTTDGTEYDVRDARDDQYYKIRKLPDGNCWMVDNLALAGSQTIDSADSDFDNDTYTLGTVANPNAQTYCANLDTAIYRHKCGLQYSWTIATAGSAVTSGDADTSICPKNWRLPKSGEYATLSATSGWSNGTGVNNSSWRGLWAGYNVSSASGSRGYYWTALASGSNAYYLRYDSSISPSYSSMKSNQFNIRCLVR
jgi:uncharacterized protein (TIGR02145 family)